MPITESQLDTWSHQGSVAQSKATCDTIRGVLEAPDAPYASRKYKTFLQGSYANDTNIYADSDVDIVMRLDSVFYQDLDNLPQDQKEAYQKAFSDAEYSCSQFKQEVVIQLSRPKYFGSAVTAGNKAIFIKGNGNRRDADVLPAAQFRKYTRFRSFSDQSYVEGICFWTSDGTRIVNHPKQHSDNCTSKHQQTNSWFKKTVRVWKNARNRMVADGVIKDGLAPSYFVEGMLYNVPSANFGGSHADTFVKCLNWLHNADRSKLVCANEQYKLLHDTSPVTWRKEKYEAFVSGLIAFWNAWGK